MAFVVEFLGKVGRKLGRIVFFCLVLIASKGIQYHISSRTIFDDGGVIAFVVRTT